MLRLAQQSPDRVLAQGDHLGFAWVVMHNAMGYRCFAPGTVVLTRAGHCPIEKIRIGDEVLTHLRRWRPVVAVGSRWAEETVVLRGQGIPDVRVTPDHPILTRTSRRTSVVVEGKRKRPRAFSSPNWTSAGSSVGRYVAQLTAPDVSDDEAPDLWWIGGRWLADGWANRKLTRGRGHASIVCALGEAEYLRERLSRVFSKFSRWDRGPVATFTVAHRRLRDFVAPFGDGAANKRMPGHALGLDSVRAESLLDGYLTGDGHRVEKEPGRGGIWTATTVSRPLAFAVACLAQRARGVVASMYLEKRPEFIVWNGKRVSQLPAYHVVVPDRNHSAMVEGSYGWKLVRSVKPAPGCQVYNLSVAEDESYVADGIVSHNCGYVRVPRGHPWHGLDYDAVPCEVHGGLTFCDPEQANKCEKDAGFYWLGFDCAHGGDAPDPGLMDEAHRQLQRELPALSGLYRGEVRDQAYVEAECRSLCEQAAQAWTFP